MTTYRIAPLALGVAVLGSCAGSTDPRLCPASIDRGVEVRVTDAETGLPAASGVRGVVSDGPYVDSLRVVGWTGTPASGTATTVGAAEERPGTYTVRIERPGYAVWERANIVVESNACGVITRRLDAALIPNT